MSGLMYRPNQPTSLYDLLAQAQNQEQGPSVPAPPAPSQPSAVQNTGGLSPQDRQKLVDMLLAPEDPGPAPTVEKANPIAQALMAVGDAGSTFAAILGGNSGVRTNAFEQYQNRLAQQKAELRQYQEKVAQSKNRSKKEGANYLLSQDAAATERSLAEKAEKAKALAIAQETARKEALVKDAATLKREQDLADDAAHQKFELEKMKLNRDWDMKIEQFRAAHKDPDEKKAKQGEKDQASFAKGVQIALALRDGDPKSGLVPFAEQVKQGVDPKVLATQLRNRFEEELDAEGVFGTGRDLARNFFNRKMIEAFESATAPQP
jgi:hypothetical protein